MEGERLEEARGKREEPIVGAPYMPPESRGLVLVRTYPSAIGRSPRCPAQGCVLGKTGTQTRTPREDVQATVRQTQNV